MTVCRSRSCAAARDDAEFRPEFCLRTAANPGVELPGLGRQILVAPVEREIIGMQPERDGHGLAILVERYRNLGRVAIHRFINRVIQYLPHQMV